MRNPLNKRILREIRGDLGKYLVIFLMMVLFIGLVAGYQVAGASMLAAHEEGLTSYHVENGFFDTTEEMNLSQIKSAEDLGICIYENYYEDFQVDQATLRVYAKRQSVDLECLMEGEYPDQTGEIAIDRNYARNNDISIGDQISSEDGSKTWTVVGFVALSDYNCLFYSNNDSMFDAKTFGVAIVTEEEFAGFNQSDMTYHYSWLYDHEPEDEDAEKEISDDLSEDLSDIVSIENFVPRYMNQAITFAAEDIGGDDVFVEWFFYILIVILAFVFAITITNTIASEATVIGTLRASGYTRGELVRHYLAAPMVVSIFSAIVGNIIGYTFFVKFISDIYYRSYSLPTFVTLFMVGAFLKTTIVPLVLIFIVNWVALTMKLQLPPIKFLRRDLKKNKPKKAHRLPVGMPIFHRFRLRVLGQNISNYIMLFLGIAVANFLLYFGLMFPPLLSHYEEIIPDTMFANYQYILTIPASLTHSDSKLDGLMSLMDFYDQIDTDNETAEKFTAYSLSTTGENGERVEEISIYGIVDDSRYFDFTLTDDDVYISKAYADKQKLQVGDTITLKEEYGQDRYDFTITGITDYEGGLDIFMSQDAVNDMFDLGEGFYCGYFSDTEINDIDDKYIGSVIDYDELTKMSKQLSLSMGSMMKLVEVLALIIFAILIYLLSKIIIEKNAQSISLAKILGYKNTEIARLYILPTSIMVVVFMALSIPIISVGLKIFFQSYMATELTGWIPYYAEPTNIPKMFLMGLGTYALVVLLEIRKIGRVPMEEALKNVE